MFFSVEVGEREAVCKQFCIGSKPGFSRLPFLARLDKVQEELLYFPRRRR